MAKDCEFQEEENMIRDQIVYHVFDKAVQGRMLRNNDLKLKDACDICRAAESSQNQLNEMRKQETTPVNEMGTQGQIKCFQCNGFGHIATNCPKGSARENQPQCFNCSGYGHKSRDCPSGDSYDRGRRRRGRGRGRGRGKRGGRGGSQVDEFQDGTADSEEYVKEFSLHSIKINAIDDPSNQRFVNF